MPRGRRKLVQEPAPRRAVLKQLKQPYYDTEVNTLAAPVAALNFFTRPLGQADNAAVPKTRYETNLGTSGQLPKPRSLDLYGFRMKIFNGNAATAIAAPPIFADLYAILYRARFEFRIGDSRVIEVPLDEIPQGVGFSGVPVIDGSAAPIDRPVMTRGVGSVYEVLDISIEGEPRRIDHGEQIAGLIQWHAGAPLTITQNMSIRVSLVGISYVGVE